MELDKSEKSLIRGLGRFEATTLIIGGMVGTTIFLITSDVANIVQVRTMGGDVRGATGFERA